MDSKNIRFDSFEAQGHSGTLKVYPFVIAVSPARVTIYKLRQRMVKNAPYIGAKINVSYRYL